MHECGNNPADKSEQGLILVAFDGYGHCAGTTSTIKGNNFDGVECGLPIATSEVLKLINW
jgi:hypothetical protein